jgi:hypothetical protein
MAASEVESGPTPGAGLVGGGKRRSRENWLGDLLKSFGRPIVTVCSRRSVVLSSGNLLRSSSSGDVRGRLRVLPASVAVDDLGCW